MAFPYLFQPMDLGPVTTSNRIVMPPMTTRFANSDGSVSDRISEYYKARARGGAGLIIVEMACVTQDERALPRQLAIWSNRFVKGLNGLADSIRSEGSIPFLQLQHSGREAYTPDWHQPVAPSSVPGPQGAPRELSVPEVQGLVNDFASAALRAKEAGFDGIEFHGAHAYLIQQFLSPLWNKRNDEYGGSVEKRARFALEILQDTRRKVGGDFPVLVRINGDDFVDGGQTLEQAIKVAALLKEAGATCIHVSGGTAGNLSKMVAPSSEPMGYRVHLAKAIKNLANMPVIASGRIGDPDLAERIVAEGEAHLIAMGRPLIADPELPNKAKEGRTGDIRRCLSCCHCLGSPGGVACTVNAAAGREKEAVIVAAESPKKVVVIGGGPAGLEAARIAASRGHTVTLYEKSVEIGGQLPLAATPPFKGEFNNFTRFLVSQVNKLGVNVILGQEETPEQLNDRDTDVVVLATGSRPRPLEIPGSEKINVVDARSVISGASRAEDKVIVIGGGQVGCETTLLLHNQKKHVVIVEMLPQIASDVKSGIERGILLQWLQETDIEVKVNCQAIEITEQGLMVNSPEGNSLIPADTIVTAVGAIPNDDIVAEMRKRFGDIHVIGDAAGPRKIVDAIREGHDIGRSI
ncbi:FAD-dependent oxidoreductase [Chloroflexota bacterium]